MSQNIEKSRREFLKLAGVAAPAVALTATSTPADAETVRLSDRGDACMRDTDHTRRYYELAQF